MMEESLQQTLLHLVDEGIKTHAVYAVDGHGRISSWSQGAQRLFGHTEIEILGRAEDVLRPAGHHEEGEGWWLRQGGDRFRASCLSRTLTQSEGQPAGHARLVHDLSERRELNERLRRMSTTDFLTGALNRRHFYKLAAQEIARRQRYGTPLALMLLDADQFRTINDQLGQAAGDTVLRTMVRTCMGLLRDVDIMVRLGGEEFAILLPETDAAGAATLAARLRDMVADTLVVTEAGETGVTVSLGVTEMSEQTDNLEKMLQAAAAALLEAKAGGRGRVAISTAQATGIILAPASSDSESPRHGEI